MQYEFGLMIALKCETDSGHVVLISLSALPTFINTLSLITGTFTPIITANFNYIYMHSHTHIGMYVCIKFNYINFKQRSYKILPFHRIFLSTEYFTIKLQKPQ